MRREKILDIKSVLRLITVFGTTKEGELITLDLQDMLLLVTVFDIALKALSSDEPYRFLPVLEDDEVKRAVLRSELMLICTEMTSEFSEQAICRHEVGQHKLSLIQFEY